MEETINQCVVSDSTFTQSKKIWNALVIIMFRLIQEGHIKIQILFLKVEKLLQKQVSTIFHIYRTA